MSIVSDITVAALTATPTLRGNKLAWTYSDPRSGAIPNIALDMVEVWASTTNDRATAAKVGEGITDFLHTGLVEEQAYYYWIKARDYLPAAQGGPGYGAWHPTSSTAGVSATAVGISGLAYGLANGKLVTSVAASALTVAIKTIAGNNPSASDPVFVAFRTAAGGYVIRTITAALSVTISATSTLGHASSGSAFRVWVVLLDDTAGSGNLLLGAIQCVSESTKQIYPLNESRLESTTAEGGAGGADSAQVIYAATATASPRPMRVIGSLTWETSTVAGGAWVVPDFTKMFGMGMKLPGDIVIEKEVVVNSVTGNITSVIPLDASLPLISEGTSVGTISITPESGANVIEMVGMINGSPDSTDTVIGTIGSSLNSNVYVAGANNTVGGTLGQVSMRARAIATVATVRTIDLRVGSHAGGGAGGVTVNGIAGVASLSTGLLSWQKVTEYVG